MNEQIGAQRFSASKLPADMGSMAGQQGREFEWSDADFSRVQSLIYKRAGISLHDGKHAMVYSRLSRRLRDTGFRSFREYLSWLESTEGPEWQEFVKCTDNQSHFFFENNITSRRSRVIEVQTSGSWRVWCSAASTGEEPYSIVMTALDALGSRPNFTLKASDIDSKVLATASRAFYRLDGMKGVDTARMQRYFMRGTGANSGMVRVQSELQKYVEFLIVNLISGRLAVQGAL